MIAGEFCPACFASTPGEPCDCAQLMPTIVAPRGRADLIVHLAGRSSSPAVEPWALLDDSVFDGPRVHPVAVPSGDQLVGRQRAGTSLWLAQARWSELPFARPGAASPAEARLRRLLARSSMLLIDHPSSAGRGADGIDQLVSFLDVWRLPIDAIALVGPAGGTLADDCAKLAIAGPVAEGFATHDAAVRWLVSTRGRGTAARSTAAPAVDSAPVAAPPSAFGEIAVMDVGGHVAWEWFSAITETPLLPPPSAPRRVARLFGQWLTQLERRVTRREPMLLNVASRSTNRRSIRVTWGQSGQTRPFRVAYTPHSAPRHAPMVAGIGPLAFLGERDFVALMQVATRRERTPVVLIRDEDTHPRLWRWAKREFPQARTFSVHDKAQTILRYVLERTS
jgi:hypothetical protein